MRLTASKVDTHSGCPYLYYLRYVAKPLGFVTNKHMVMGNIVHRALQLYHQAPWVKSLGDCFKQTVDEELGFGVRESDLIKKTDLLDIKAMLKDYVPWRKRLPPEREIVSLEREFTFEINGIIVTGRVDRLDRIKNDYYVVDYKTSKHVTDMEEVDQSVQLPTYALWIRKKIDKAATVFGQYVYLRHLRNMNANLPVVVTESLIERTIKRYVEMAKLLREGCSFPRNVKYRYHSVCEYYDFCMKDNDNNYSNLKGDTMVFVKTGDAPIAAVYCPCGGQIDMATGKCGKCGKEQVQPQKPQPGGQPPQTNTPNQPNQQTPGSPPNTTKTL